MVSYSKSSGCTPIDHFHGLQSTWSVAMPLMQTRAADLPSTIFEK